jgi:hypothetical protein
MIIRVIELSFELIDLIDLAPKSFTMNLYPLQIVGRITSLLHYANHYLNP